MSKRVVSLLVTGVLASTAVATQVSCAIATPTSHLKAARVEMEALFSGLAAVPEMMSDKDQAVALVDPSYGNL